MRVESITITGLKGGRRHYDLASQFVMIQGDNGTGKTSISNAIDFLLGARVEGAESTKGRGLIGLVHGDRLCVEAQIDGTTYKREREIDRGTFKKAKCFINGREVDSLQLLPSVRFDVRALVAASPDVTRSELATIATWSGHKADLSELQETYEARTLDAIKDAHSTVAKRSRARVRDARAVFEDARKRSPDAPVRPEALSAVEKMIEDEETKLAEWKGRMLALRSELVSAEALDELNAEVRRQLEALPTEGADPAPARDYAESIKTELDERRRELDEATKSIAVIDDKINTLRAISGDLCPTCGRPGAREAIDASIEALSSPRAALDSDFVELRNEIRELEDDHEAAVSAVRDAEKKQESFEKRSRLKVQSGKGAQQVLDEIREHRAAEPDREQLDKLRADARKLATKRAEQIRFNEAMAERDEAEAEAECVKAAGKKIADVEAELVEQGLEVLTNAAAPYLPELWSISLVEGRIGLTDGDSSWYGVGLSAAQRAILETSLELGVASERRIVVVEADTMSDQTLTIFRDALEVDVSTGVVDLAVVISCHEVPRRDGWQVIRTTPDIFGGQGLLDEAADTGPGAIPCGTKLGDIEGFIEKPCSGCDGSGCPSCYGTGYDHGPESKTWKPTTSDEVLGFTSRFCDHCELYDVYGGPCARMTLHCGGIEDEECDLSVWVAEGDDLVCKAFSEDKPEREFNDEPNLFRVRGVAKKLSPAAKKFMRLEEAPHDDQIRELWKAGLSDRRGVLNAAGEFAARMLRGLDVDGVRIEDDERPVPGAGVSEKEARRILREHDLSTAALRSLIAPAPEKKPTAAQALRAAAYSVVKRGMDEDALRVAAREAADVHPKRRRRSSEAD